MGLRVVKRAGLLAACVLLVSSSAALAEPSFASLYRSFRGRFLVSEQPLVDVQAGSSAKEVKKRSQKALQSEDVDGIATWTFHYAAFLSRAPKTSEVSLDFHKIDKERTYVGNMVISVDPGTTILIGDLEFDEDLGPAKGITYEVVVRTRGLKRERDLARARIALN
jgi:hypothetical protein